MEQDQLLTKKQIAAHFQVTEMTIDRWRKKGLPYSRAGVKLIRFDLKEVTEWLDAQNK